MDSLPQLLAFAETARHGGFAAAARRVGGTPSTLAKSVARLERALGVKLFHRTTRQVSLTPDGERLFLRCQRVLEELESLQAEASGARTEPAGTLRVDLPITYGKSVVMPVLAGLVRRYPGLRLEVRLQDAYADLVKDRIDLAVRVGDLGDSSLVARRIDSQQLIVLASPDYLAERGTPRRIEDLASHVALAFRMPSSGRERPWQFRHRGRALEMPPPARVHVNDGEGLVSAARLGAGLCQVPDYMATGELADGSLVEVLAPFRPAPMPISAVVPSGRLLPARVRVAIDALAAATRERAGGPSPRRPVRAGRGARAGGVGAAGR
ncbi:MAG TPA: LysR family transcriptional regulator [Burkholderiaceae bacterium]|nr:LysR family transcriptional regulator [Burkholderiaceae bacterium]